VELCNSWIIASLCQAQVLSVFSFLTASEPLTTRMASATLCSQMTAATEHLAKARKSPSEEACETHKPLAGNQSPDEDKARLSHNMHPFARTCRNVEKSSKFSPQIPESDGSTIGTAADPAQTSPQPPGRRSEDRAASPRRFRHEQICTAIR